MGNKFGWHSGTLTCQEAKVKGDLYVQDDIVFSDVSAGVLGITGGIDMQSTSSAIGIDIGGTFTTSAIDIDGTLSGRAIRIGKKCLDGTSTDGSLAITAPAGTAVDTEPANNYLFGLFSKVATTAATSNDELRSTWIRTRVNQGCHVGSNAGWGYGVCGAEIQLKVYADTAATNMYSWQNSAVWAQLETQGASGVNFKTGSYSQCVLANVGLTSTTTIDSGANVAGVTINSNTASAVTATGGFYGLFITQKTAGLLDFTSGIYINADSCTTGIEILACTTGLSISGATTTAISLSGDATTGISITSGMSATAMISMAGTGTDGILISGACGDAIHLSGTNTTSALHISGDQAIFELLDVDASATDGIKMSVDDTMTLTTGINILQTGTTGVITTGIDLASGCVTGIDIGTCTTGINFTGAYTIGIKLGTHDWGVGSTGITITATSPLLQVAGKVTGANVAAGVYACEYEQLALTSSQNLDVSMFASWNELYITGGTINLTGSSHYSAVKGHVEVAGTVTSSTGTTASLWGSNIIPATYTNNGTIAGCTIDMILNNGYTDSGIIAAYTIGAHTDPGQNKIPIGLYMPYNAVKRGLLMGSPWASAGSTGLKILTDNTTWSTGATVGIYFDDGGSALTAWGEGFTVGQAVLTNSTGGAQTGWPYTAFFYLDIEADITTAATQHWANVMTSAIIGSGKTVDGFTSHGISSLHTSCDINGTLSANNTMSNISFGGNSPGTITGDWVCMHVRDTTGNFSGLLKVDTNATGCYTQSYTGNSAFVPNSKGTFTQTGQLRIIVAGNTVYIPYGTVA